jgi:hypothetical protein
VEGQEPWSTVIVRDAGDAWHVVLQTDHADLSGACARQWVDTGARHASLVVAAERHDDGWAVWEQSPMVDADTGRPVSFLDVPVPAHLAFYRAGIAAITDEDAYAGLLVSMHGAGIYRHRYGTQPELKLSRADEVKDLVDAFVAEQEASHPLRRDEIGVTEEERWADYFRLQVYDRFSLFFCLKDIDAGESEDIGGYRLESLGQGRVRMDPYPFLSDPVGFTLLRRVVPKRPRTADEFRHALLHSAAEPWEIHVEAG